MSDAAVEYDRVAYPGSPIESAFVPRLAAAAILNGHPAPAVEGSRVLDIGCGDGHNIIAMAVSLPGTVSSASTSPLSPSHAARPKSGLSAFLM